MRKRKYIILQNGNPVGQVYGANPFEARGVMLTLIVVQNNLAGQVVYEPRDIKLEPVQ